MLHYLVKYDENGHPAVVAIAANWLDASLLPGFKIIGEGDYYAAIELMRLRAEREEKEKPHDES